MNGATKEAAGFAGAPGDGSQSSCRKVLIIDDDPAMRRLVCKVLDSAGYEVVHAGDGLEAIELMREELPSFVITDWDMPVLDGAELCRMIRQAELPHYVYIVMLTGTCADRLVEGLAAGADDFITKPLKAAELLARMQTGARILRLEGSLRLLASRDPLTGLLNRRTFFQLIEDEWDRSNRIGYPLACAMIDVDFFKRVNDAYGHLAGDVVLKSVSRTLQDSCRKTDHVCRYGGEEFCVFMPDTQQDAAARWADRFRSAIAGNPTEVGRASIPVTVSVGVAQRDRSTGNPEKLLDLADRALLRAKARGRNRVELSEESCEKEP